jgi:predicted transcriptional regulator
MSPAKQKSNDERLLTEAELELMAILWKLGEGSVTDVMGALPKPAAYTTVSTILRILEQKGVLRTRKEGRGHIYIPALPKEDYEARAVKHVVERVFEGAPVALARQLLRSDSLSEADLAELRSLLEAKGGKS